MKKLRYVNNWENDEYYVDDKLIEDLEIIKIDDKEYKVTGKRISVSYNDMGHTYSALSRHYFITERVFGIDIEFDLNRIVPKRRVFAVKYI